MELRHMRLFAAAAREGHLTKAAEFLGIDQPSASRYLKQLEKSVGGELFYRKRRPLHLTPLGAALAERIEPLVEAFDTLLDGLVKEADDRPVVLAGTSQTVSRQVPEVVERFLEVHPEDGLRIRELPRNAIASAIANGEVDIGILQKSDLGEKFEFTSLGKVDELLITKIGHPLMESTHLTLREIAQHPIIFQARLPQSGNALRAAMRRRGIKMNEIMELDSFLSVKRYVGLGMGISVVPSFVVEASDQGHIMGRKLDVLPIHGEFGLVTLKEKPLTAAMKELITIAQEVLSNKFDATYAVSLLSRE